MNNPKPSMMQFMRMYLAYLNFLLDHGISLRFWADPANTTGDGIVKFISDFDLNQIHGLVMALCRMPGHSMYLFLVMASS